jgi:hypothetical protein
MHWIFCFVQFEHGCFLSHLTLRRRHVTQDREFSPAAALGDELKAGLWTLLSVEELALVARRAGYSSVIVVYRSGVKLSHNDSRLFTTRANGGELRLSPDVMIQLEVSSG